MFTGMCVDMGRCSLVYVWTHVDVHLYVFGHVLMFTVMCVNICGCSLVCVWTHVDVHWYVCGHR